MVTVDGDARVVERRLAAGRLRCPGCPGGVAGWGHARPGWSGVRTGSAGGCARGGRGAGAAG